METVRPEIAELLIGHLRGPRTDPWWAAYQLVARRVCGPVSRRLVAAALRRLLDGWLVAALLRRLSSRSGSAVLVAAWAAAGLCGAGAAAAAG